MPVELLPSNSYSQETMLNFIPRNQHYPALLLMRAWAFWSVAAPLGMTCLCLLLLVGFAALVGAPIGTVAAGFLVDVLEPLAQVSVQLWMTAFFMMVLFYGVSRQLIHRTLKKSLSAPLAVLLAHIREKIRRMVVALVISCGSVTLPLHISLPCNTRPKGHPLPIALLPGTAPLLE